MAAGQASGSQGATLIGALIAVIVLAAVGLVFGKDAVIAAVAIAFVSVLLSSKRETLGGICLILFALIYLVTLWVASSGSIPAIVLSMFLPGIAQAYWIWVLLADGKTLFHPLILMCGAWLILFGAWFVARKKSANA
jgi:hypothetical protein